MSCIREIFIWMVKRFFMSRFYFPLIETVQSGTPSLQFYEREQSPGRRRKEKKRIIGKENRSAQ